jgi:hypothetical protein
MSPYPAQREMGTVPFFAYSTVTLLARLRG